VNGPGHLLHLLGLHYKFINHAAYNRDRGPVSVFGLRLHVQY
jgi:high affinity Mn2+ porin